MLGFLACGGLARAEIVDRVAIAIGHDAITESQIDEEVRVTAMLNHAPLQFDAATRRRAAQRLVNQYLIGRETESSRFPGADAKDVAAYLAKVEEDFGGAAGFERALAAYELTRGVLERHLALQLRTLAFARFRFPSDEALNIWLAEARRRFEVRYLGKDLQ